MTAWLILLLFIFIILGIWFGKEKGVIIAFVIWLLVCGLTILALASTNDGLFSFLVLALIPVSAIVSYKLFVYAQKILFLKRILQHDHEGGGCMFLTLTTIAILHLLGIILKTLYYSF